jgi:type IV secretion system protein VirB3
MNAGRTDGFEVPLHRSLVQPLLIAGLPRSAALTLWTGVAALFFGAHQLWILPIGLLLHVGGVAATKVDPYVFDVFLCALKVRGRFVP